MSTIRGAFFLLNVTLIKELFEDPAERLLGDFQDVQQFCNLHPGIAIDEMQDPVMRASEAEFVQNLIRIANEVPVGEKQEFDQVERCRVPLPGFSWDQMTHRGFEIYVSHVDIFLVFCYGNEVLCETIVRAPSLPSPACGGG